MTTAVRFDRVSRHFGSVRAVDEVSLAIPAGEFFAMLGPRARARRPACGSLRASSSPMRAISRSSGRPQGVPPYRRNVNTVFQDYALFPHMSVIENVGYGLMVRGVGRVERQAKAREALAMVQLDGLESRRPLQLSGGQRQRVALARALANEPKVLLLDEPLGALDLKLREQMQSELKSLQQALGITFVFVTHDQSEALVMADRVAIFNDGRIVQIGTPQDIYERPRSRFVADFVGSSNLLAPDAALNLGAPGRWASLRPEKIAVGDPKQAWPEGAVGVDGTVTGAHYLGAVTRVTVGTAAGRLTAAVAALNGFAPGQPVRLSWPREAMHVMEDEA